jgi:hypothetical protein
MSDGRESFMGHIEKSRMPLLKIASKALRKLSTRKEPVILTFWGNKGIGKTTLLKNMGRHLIEKNKVQLVEIHDINKLSLEQINVSLRQKFEDISENEPAILLLDDLDELLRKDKDGQPFFDFERNTILPFVTRGNVLILATSQIELNQWREDDIRMRQSNHPIPALTFEEITSLFSNTSLQTEKVYEFTLGHPKVLSWLLKSPTVTEKELVQKAWEYFLEDIPDDARHIAEIIYLMPVFNIHILQRIYKNLTGKEAQYLDCLGWIKEYIRRGLLYWDVSIGSYRFTDSAVRRLLARHVLFENLSKFDNVQQLASDYFQDEAKSPGYLHMHFVSAIYHFTQTKRDLPPQEVGKKCLEWVRSNINSWMSRARWDEVLSAWQSGADEDAVRDEIQDLISSTHFNAITQEIEKAKQMMEVTK